MQGREFDGRRKKGVCQVGPVCQQGGEGLRYRFGSVSGWAMGLILDWAKCFPFGLLLFFLFLFDFLFCFLIYFVSIAKMVQNNSNKFLYSSNL
jgi:hypothetical protein